MVSTQLSKIFLVPRMTFMRCPLRAKGFLIGCPGSFSSQPCVIGIIYPHLTDEEPKRQRCDMSGPESHDRKGYNQYLYHFL
jgi:hypothetical protein